MTEKQTFFYKETPKGRIDLGTDFMNAFPIDPNLNTLPQVRSKEK